MVVKFCKEQPEGTSIRGGDGDTEIQAARFQADGLLLGKQELFSTQFLDGVAELGGLFELEFLCRVAHFSF